MRLLPVSTAFAATLLGACASTPATPDANNVPNGNAAAIQVPAITHPQGESAAWWYRSGAARAAANGAMAGKAKNVIVFLGDGMSLTTVAAARILQGQQHGASGEENTLAFEQFPHTALSKTYNTDTQTPDSAGTMSAIATGVKTRAGVLSIGQSAALGDCAGALAAPMLTLWELAEGAGLATGVISTARVTHATPGATFSHSAHRDWENDAALPDAAVTAGCIDIARQMVESAFGNGPDVLLGGGRSQFMPVAQRDPEYDDKAGKREDGRDLIAAWQQRHPGGVYAWNAGQFAAAPVDAPLLALFEPSHMHYEHDRSSDRAGEPSLAELTRAAIAHLQRDDHGFVLLVEGGRIDHANHEGNAWRALTDTIAMSDAVQVAAQMTSADDTLILVTADHAHTLSMVGYPARGNPILGKVRENTETPGAPQLARDALGLPYATLNYSNGPGYAGASAQQPAGAKTYPHAIDAYQPAVGRPDLSQVDTTDPDYLQEALVPMGDETHGGEDVGVWARGPGAEAVRGTIEQNVIFHLLVQATPALRARLCQAGTCNADGVPVELPRPADFKAE